MLNPFIPKSIANAVIVDGSISADIRFKFREMNIEVIPTIPCMEVMEPISFHPDVVIHPINHNTLIVAPNVFDYYEERLSCKGIKIIRGETELGRGYPEDIAYNVGRTGKFAIHNFKYTDEKLKYYLRAENVEFLNVRQGYTKCSMAIVDDNAIITSDYPIYNALLNKGIDALLVDPGNIDIKGFPYGFIGGATGNLSKDTILFSGNIDAHPNKTEIFNFIKKYNKRIILLSNKKAMDIGTVISLYCQ